MAIVGRGSAGPKPVQVDELSAGGISKTGCWLTMAFENENSGRTGDPQHERYAGHWAPSSRSCTCESDKHVCLPGQHNHSGEGGSIDSGKISDPEPISHIRAQLWCLQRTQLSILLDGSTKFEVTPAIYSMSGMLDTWVQRSVRILFGLLNVHVNCLDISCATTNKAIRRSMGRWRGTTTSEGHQLVCRGKQIQFFEVGSVRTRIEGDSCGVRLAGVNSE